MQGNIDFSGTLSGSIAGGGGGGGSDVTITPTLQSGTKIADYTIDETSGSLYAPTPQQSGVIDVQVNNTQVPDYESIVENSIAKLNLYPYLEKSEAYTIIDLVNDEIERVDDKVGNLEQIVPNKQDKLTAGNGISIDQNNVISCTASGGINYTTNEQDTGLLWTDGRHIFQKTIPIPLVSNANVLNEIDLSQYLPNDYDFSIKHETMYYHNATGYTYLLPYYIIGGAAAYAIGCGIMADKLYIISGNSFPLNGTVTTTLYYVKSVE